MNGGEVSVFSDEFLRLVVQAGTEARFAALREGHAVVWRDGKGRLVEEHPGGRCVEVRWNTSSISRDNHLIEVCEIRPSAA